MLPHEEIVQLLQNNLTDYNTGRTGNWIYSYYPELSEITEYPIIAVEPIGAPANIIGLGIDDVWETVQIEITIATKRGVFVSNMENQKLVDTIGVDVKKILRTKWKTDLPNFHNFKIINNTPLPFDEVKMLYQRVITVQFDIINAGE